MIINDNSHSIRNQPILAYFLLKLANIKLIGVSKVNTRSNLKLVKKIRYIIFKNPQKHQKQIPFRLLHSYLGGRLSERDQLVKRR